MQYSMEHRFTQMFFVFAIRAQSCNKTVLRKTFIITSKLLSYTTKTMSVINPPFISNFVLNIIHRRHNHLGQLSRKTKGRHGQEKKKITCANSHLAIAVVFALQRMLELSHFCSLPETIAVFSTVVQEFNWSTRIAREWENSREACCHPLKPPALVEELEFINSTAMEG